MKSSVHTKFMASVKRLMIVSIGFIALTPLIVHMVTGRGAWYYPGMAGTSWLIFLLCVSYYILALRMNLLARIAISIPMALVLPMLAAMTAMSLYDKGSGILRHIDFHLIAYVSLLVMSIVVCLILDRLYPLR